MGIPLHRLREQIKTTLEARDADGAWAALAPYRDQLGEDPELAWIWVDLLQTTPSKPGLAAEAKVVLDAWPEDPTLVIATCAALLGAAARFPMDAPPLREGPAHLAAKAAARCIEALPEQAKGDPEIEGYLQINRANALRMADPSLDAEAQVAFHRALQLNPDNGHWWFDLGVLHKWRGRFSEGLACALKARARIGETRAVDWNLAICATAMGDGDLAGGIWKKFGMPAELNEAGMPYVPDLPPMQVRVLAKGPGTGPDAEVPDASVGFELVWVAPLSPCHGVVQSPTFREAPIDYGDVVLWDGAPVGMMQTDAGPVPRFPLLEILNPGDEHRMRFVALQREPGLIAALRDALPPYAKLFVHQERVEVAGPLDHSFASTAPATSDADADTDGEDLVYGKIVMPQSADLRAFRATYEKAIAGGGLAMALPLLYEQLGDTKRAGQEHQAWRGVERKAKKRGLLA